MNLDTKLFYLINHLPHNKILDTLALTIHTATYGGIMYFPLLLLFWSKHPEAKRFAKFAVINAGSTYILTDLILKQLTHRVRPYLALSDAYYIPTAPGSYSFPSGQAAVAFALAVTALCIAPKHPLSYIFIAWAIIVSISRVYMGHHYPSDVITGALIGSIIPILILWTLKN